MTVTPEDIYREFHKHTVFYKTGIYPRTVKNFDKPKAKPEWVYFERLAQMVDNNAGMINYRIYIESLARHYNGWFKPALLPSMKAIKIYKIHKTIMNSTTDRELIYEGIIKSIKFIGDFCKENRIKDFDSYMYHNADYFPTMLKHFTAGSITSYFLTLIPDIKLIIRNFPQDCVEEFCEEFLIDYDLCRSKAISLPKVRKICDNLENLINKCILN